MKNHDDPTLTFPTTTAQIQARLQSIQPARYAATRNALGGAVTRLSPYLAHGALTLPQVRTAAYALAGKRASYKLVFELAWREYFQRVWWEKNTAIFADIKRPQAPVRERQQVPVAFLEASTGVRAIDASLTALYESGYVHNHARMWTAMVGANLAQVHWKPLADWYYYHLLDGDLASNTLSWQWVAGTFSSKKYWANQENLNRFDPANAQHGTFLDTSYEALETLSIPEVLQPTQLAALPCTLPEGESITVAPGQRVLLYHPWALDPHWHTDDTEALRVLVLEPSHFARHPISPRRWAFLLGLAANIPNLRVFVGEVDTLPGLSAASSVTSKAYPATRHFPGIHEAPDWLFPRWPASKPVPGSFMGFWKTVETWL